MLTAEQISANMFCIPEHFGFEIPRFFSLQDLEQSGADLEALKEEVKRSVGQVLLKKKELAIKFVAKIKVGVAERAWSALLG